MGDNGEGGPAYAPGPGGQDQYPYPSAGSWTAPVNDAPPTTPGYPASPYPAPPMPPMPQGMPGYGPGYGPSPGYGYPAPYYGAPMMARKTNGMAVAGMVLGIVSLVFFWLWFIAPLISLLGIIFSGIGISQCNRTPQEGKGMAVAGLVCSLISAAFWALIIVAIAHAFSEV